MPAAKGAHVGGRKRAPQALRALKGTQASRINKNAPKHPVASGEPPDYLTADARQVWFEVVPHLQKVDLLNVVEVEQLACYAEAVITHRDAVVKLRETGIIVLGNNGGFIKNPAASVQAEQARIIRSFAAEFGLTPATREHVSAPSETEAVEADQFFTETG